uniref:Phage Tail Protein X n=1 Tax=Candidatus Kentrum sp. TC TaxID=2126339 RepID=A0A450YW70_9GAMM|nr:MAG: Phage Tail Protein X [Candidatus Kentron sp. TC]
MTDYLRYQAVSGDRWDNLSFRYYGDPLLYERIVAANPDVPLGLAPPVGAFLRIPILAEEEGFDGEGLPPWKR